MSREVLLVTGASSDVGMALIRRLGALASPPLVVAHCHAGFDRLASLEDLVHPLVADLGDEAAVLDLAQRIEAAHGVPSQLVHLPALPLVLERFSRFDWDRFSRDLDVQLKSAVLLLRRFAPRMARMARAKVVFVLSSVTRGLPPRSLSMYTIAKHAQLGLMKALASEYLGSNLTVNAVSPGMIDTRFLAGVPELAVQMAASSSPRGRNATPEDVVGAIAFLLSPDSDYMTGVEVPVTAGGTG